MSSAKHFTEVLIGGKVYTLSGFEGEEYLQKVKLRNARTVRATESRVPIPVMYFSPLILQMTTLKPKSREIPWKAISNLRTKRCTI